MPASDNHPMISKTYGTQLGTFLLSLLNIRRTYFMVSGQLPSREMGPRLRLGFGLGLRLGGSFPRGQLSSNLALYHNTFV